jgi:hypothetical protein
MYMCQMYVCMYVYVCELKRMMSNAEQLAKVGFYTCICVKCMYVFIHHVRQAMSHVIIIYIYIYVYIYANTFI